VDISEFDAGNGQLIVVYVSYDDGSQVDPNALWAEVAQDAQQRAAAGLRIVTIAGVPLRQMGTAGNIFFQSGGQFATQTSISVVYAR
jgi:hypothetical protein